jgi:thiamine-monophosphate kinase
MSAGGPNIALGPGAEFDEIRRLVARWGARAQGIGDDAAVWLPTRGEHLVASVDTAVEGRHFERGWLTSRELGWRAAAAALSDLAAMAARPVGVLVALTVAESWQREVFEIADGIGDAVAAAGTVIRGGNISAGGELSITTTVFGEAYAPLRRAGARPGELVFVTGRLGGPGAALDALRSGKRDARHHARHHERFAHPVPRLAEARWLAANGATAAIDISDGLVSDAGHLAAASGVGIIIEPSSLPLVDGIRAREALVSGEEYELLIAAPALDTKAFSARFGIPLTAIGRVTESPAGVEVVGTRVELLRGHDHLSR